MNNYTDKEFWDNYWVNYEFEKMPSEVPFIEYMPLLKGGNSFIEIGGFPGTMATYFYKQGVGDVTILDYVLNKDVIHKVEAMYSVPKDTVKSIEADFFNFNSDKLYDIVFSYGFIEHFEDVKDVIARHVNLVDQNGKLLIVLPNFRGVNGLIQKLFDIENLNCHNLKSMEFNLLKNIMKELEVKNVRVEYTRKPMLWLRPNKGSKLTHLFVKFLSYFLKLFPFKNRYLSPFIVVYGEK